MNKCTDLKLVHYADDSTAYTSINLLGHLIEHVNCGLSKISEWLCAIRLSLNVVKYSYLINSNKKVETSSVILMCGQILSQRNEINFLGVTIDHKLSLVEL